MAIYQHYEIPGSPETPWHLTTGVLASVSLDLVVFDNPDGTQTRLHRASGGFVYDGVTDTLTGHVQSLTRTDASGATIYETFTDVAVDASAFYPDSARVVDWLLAGPDHVTGWSGKDFLIGGGGDDILSGNAGADVLDGGADRDDMSGGAGDDTYVIRPGDGASNFIEIETITEAIGEGFDTIRIEGVAPWKVSISFHSDYDSFRLGIPDSGGQILYTDITAASYSDIGTDVGQRIERIIFDDGTVWDLTGPLALTGTNILYGSKYGDTLQTTGPSTTVHAATGDDIVRGGWGRDEIDGGEGNDLLEGGDGNDALYGGLDSNPGNDILRGGNGDDGLFAGGLGHNDLDGGAGNDSLGGGEGADVLVGGTGHDQISGGGGDDLYILRAGEGGGGTVEDWELISEERNAGLDTIYLEDLTPADVKLSMSPVFPDTLRLEIKAPDGSVTYTEFWGDIGGTPGNFGERIELIKFADGTVWDLRNGLPPLDDYAPESGNDTYTVEAGKTLIVDAAHGVLANDSDVDGDPLTLTWLSGPSHGTMVKNADGSFQYTPDLGFTGEDGLSYKIEANGLFDTGQVDFTVTAPQSDGLVATDDTGAHIAFNTPGVFPAAQLLANDADAEHDPLSIVSVSTATHGTVVLDADGNPVFTAAGNYSGAASFNYTVSDGQHTATANVLFTVDAPAQILIGGPGDDSLSGGAGNDRLSGSDGSDVLVGGEGNDWMSGSAGNDTLNGGTGADGMWGAAGDDTYYVDDAGDKVFERPGGGVDEVRSSIDSILGSYVENLTLIGAVNGTGNKFDNVLRGSDGSNVLVGMIGKDVLEGGGGDDVLSGGRDSDTLVFKLNFGHDIITDFAVAQSYSAIGPDHDVLEFDHSIFADAAALFAHSTDTAEGVLVTADAGDSVLLKNATLANLQAHPEDFYFI